MNSITEDRAVPESPKPCPLCESNETVLFFEDQKRFYFRCHQCGLTFVPREFHLSLSDEKAEYDLHQNSPADEGYRRFLARLFDPLSQRLSPNSSGLDFGCGPGPALSVMFEEAGHSVEIFDPFYVTNDSILENRFDFVTATEVVEHFRQPRLDLQRMWTCVKPGGWLGIMTKLALDKTAFSKWHYKEDLTHVSFFAIPTFEWLASEWKAELEFIGKDVILIRRRGSAASDPC